MQLGARCVEAALVLTAWIGPGAAAAQVPSPQSSLGFEVGSDRKLADWNEITAYFNRLARTSDRVEVDTLGTTTLGRPFILLTISSPENLRRLGAYRDTLKKSGSVYGDVVVPNFSSEKVSLSGVVLTSTPAPTRGAWRWRRRPGDCRP